MNMFSRNPFDDRPDGLTRRLADLPPSEAGLWPHIVRARRVAVIVVHAEQERV